MLLLLIPNEKRQRFISPTIPQHKGDAPALTANICQVNSAAVRLVAFDETLIVID